MPSNAIARSIKKGQLRQVRAEISRELSDPTDGDVDIYRRYAQLVVMERRLVDKIKLLTV